MKHFALFFLLLNIPVCIQAMDKEKKKAAPEDWEKVVFEHILMPTGQHKARSYSMMRIIASSLKETSKEAQIFMNKCLDESTLAQPSECGRCVLQALLIHPEKNSLFKKMIESETITALVIAQNEQ